MVASKLQKIVERGLLEYSLTRRVYQSYRVKKLINSGQPINLNLGCGNNKQKGHVNIDANPDVMPDLVALAENLYMFPSNSVDSIESYHLLEHLHLEQARTALREWFRVLKPGGTLVLELPNLEVCASELGKHIEKEDPKWVGIDWAMVGIYGFPFEVANEGLWQCHKWGWSPASLQIELGKMGFEQVIQRPVKQTWRKGFAFSRDMQLRAIKPISA